METGFRGDADKVNDLISAGADIKTRGQKGWTALVFAAYGANPVCLKALVAANADLSAQNIVGRTALMYAKSTEIANTLRAAGAR